MLYFGWALLRLESSFTFLRPLPRVFLLLNQGLESSGDVTGHDKRCRAKLAGERLDAGKYSQTIEGKRLKFTKELCFSSQNG
jgi:hypothetical protein